MANTTNLDLVKPLGTDHALISVINGNMDKIDAFAGEVNSTDGSMQSGIAIVADGDTHAAIAAGQYVYIKNHNTLNEGLYTANSAIAANAALTSSNVTAVSGGGMNALSDQIGTLNTNKADFEITTWTPGIDRATFTVVSGSNHLIRVGNIVFASCQIIVTASQTSNAYISSASRPSFGKTVVGVEGTWFDNTADKQGTLGSYGSANIWFGYQGLNHPLTDQVGHSVSINMVYALV